MMKVSKEDFMVPEPEEVDEMPERQLIIDSG